MQETLAFYEIDIIQYIAHFDMPYSIVYVHK